MRKGLSAGLWLDDAILNIRLGVADSELVPPFFFVHQERAIAGRFNI